VPKPIKLLEGIGNGWINISYFYDLLESMGNCGGWTPADLYFVPMSARTALPPNANFGLFDWS